MLGIIGAMDEEVAKLKEVMTDEEVFSVAGMDFYRGKIAGKECVIVGRSNIVGKLMSLLMLRENATVTVTHSKTKDLPTVCSRADILIAAIGRPRFITKEYVKEGAVVIDVGINRDENGKLCGDVDFEDVFDRVGAITPVPGGVGPMTIAMLLHNCVEAVSDVMPEMRG